MYIRFFLLKKKRKRLLPKETEKKIIFHLFQIQEGNRDGIFYIKKKMRRLYL